MGCLWLSALDFPGLVWLKPKHLGQMPQLCLHTGRDFRHNLHEDVKEKRGNSEIFIPKVLEKWVVNGVILGIVARVKNSQSLLIIEDAGQNHHDFCIYVYAT